MILRVPANPVSVFARAGDLQPLAATLGICTVSYRHICKPRLSCIQSILVRVFDGMYHHCVHGMQVDPVGLGEGLHYAEVQAFDSKAKWRGPLFRCKAPPMCASDAACVCLSLHA